MFTSDAFLRAHVDARHDQLHRAAHPCTVVDRPVVRRNRTWLRPRARSRLRLGSRAQPIKLLDQPITPG